MAITLLRFVIQLGSQRRQLCCGHRLARAAECGKENRVHTEDLPGQIADSEVEVVEFAHPQFLGSLAEFSENLGHKRRQSVAVQVRGEAAGYHQAVRQSDKRSTHTV